MKRLNANTQQAQAIVNDYRYYVKLGNGAGHIFNAYERPSKRKVNTYDEIEKRAKTTEGYNHDLTVAGHNSNFYSTVYTFTDGEGLHIVKDTYANTYEVVVNE